MTSTIQYPRIPSREAERIRNPVSDINIGTNQLILQRSAHVLGYVTLHATPNPLLLNQPKHVQKANHFLKKTQDSVTRNLPMYTPFLTSFVRGFQYYETDAHVIQTFSTSLPYNVQDGFTWKQAPI